MTATALHRRAFLRTAGIGLGAHALSHLVATQQGSAAAGPHRPPKARSIIFVHLTGAPSQLDLWDYKPELQKHDRQPAPASFFEGKRFSFLRGHPKLLGTPYRFQQHGQSGAWLSELLPHLGSVAGDITFIRSMHTTEFNHAPAQLLCHTGQNRQGHPAIGSWVDYGLGSENSDLPGYVVFVSGAVPGGGSSLWGSGFLPSLHQGTEFRSSGEPVLFLGNPAGITAGRRQHLIEGITALNQERHQATAEPEILTRIRQYEMAFRMQSSVPGLASLLAENGLAAPPFPARAKRVIFLFMSGGPSHVDLFDPKPKLSAMNGQPLPFAKPKLERTKTGEGGNGCEHLPFGFTMWMAGGGVKGGLVHGATDDFGWHAVRDKVHVHDLHATILHLMGLDHERLTYRSGGRDYRLTDVAGKVVKEILA